MRQGFDRSVTWATSLRRARDYSEDEAEKIIDLARASAEHVFRWHPVANKCLEQSLLLCRYLVRRGIKAELIVAVRKYPFESHAWARWGEVDLTAPPASHPEDFQVIARF